MRRALAALVAAVVLGIVAACGTPASSTNVAQAPAFEPTDPILLSTNSPTRDEDPSVLRARDGSLYVAWFSDRGGNSDLYLARTTNGREWTAPIRITTSPEGDFYPTLLQDDQGALHLTWFRWSVPGRGNIWYNRSADGLTWSPATEMAVTTAANVDDWVPTLAQASDGRLLVYFVSDARDPANPTNEIYVASKRPADASWSAPAPVAAINSAREHDHLPFAARTGTGITLVWVRHDTSQILPWLNAKSDLHYSTSPDGLSWTPPAAITREAGAVVNLFPALFSTLDAQWSFLWLSTRLGAPAVFEVPVAAADRYPTGVVENRLLPAGYSHRVAATSTPGIYLAAWVQGPDGAQDIYYRFFRR